MIIAALAFFGIIFGSFVNALVWRIHEKDDLEEQIAELKEKSKPPVKKIKDLRSKIADASVTKGRSMCPNCRHTLAAKDLVPVLSWLQLRGRCRYCHSPISWQYPVVELLTGALFVLSYICWPLNLQGVGLFQFVIWLWFVVVFVALAVYDLRWFLLPDKLVLPVTLVAAIQVVIVAIWTHSFSMLWQAGLGGLILFGLFYTLFQVSKGAWIGGGDVKIALALGLLAGTPLKAFLVLFFASLLGTLVSTPMLARGRAGLKVHIPFGPYLLLATVVVVLYGTHIVNWYRNLFIG